MISSFSIILENDILYCSDEKKYNAFEIILFTEKLLRSINPRNTWRLRKICLKHKRSKRERIIVEHMVTKVGQNIFFCSIGNFAVGSTESFKMLRDFAKQVQVQYNDLDRLKSSSDEPTFKDVIKLITDYLKDKYLDPLEEETIYEKTNNNGQNAILYAGISAQGPAAAASACRCFESARGGLGVARPPSLPTASGCGASGKSHRYRSGDDK